ncbi:DUF6443 domain-containing protein [Bacteroides oleiciplenus]|uniref:DUF6443 domain-containing protein n=1 Tax=Bacteroides oleiciplenus TaxID=626931 RepID=UPI0026DD925C|nr:DUF6443 domain-containing protein [Bacteroides oleiciplenus]
MKHTYYILFILMCFQETAIAQVSTQNYIRIRTYNNGSTSYIDEISYFDGLGRPFQTVLKGVKAGSPSGSNLVTLQEYDAAGREVKNWLPIPTSNEYIDPATFKSGVIAEYSNDSRRYNQTNYESSPLNRATEQYGPGAAWSSHPIATDYLANTISSPLNCINYQVNSTGGLTKNGDYSAGQLYVTKITDEDNNVSYQFTDKQGRTLLTRQMEGNEAYDTYYVYDNHNNLSFVLQPMYQESGASLDLNSFQYKYDGRNRCIEKKLPGAQPVYYVYDMANNLIFSQDGEQRDHSEWTFSIPDALGRTVLTGICMNSFSYNADPLNQKVVKAVWGNTNNTNKGYAITGVSLTSPVIYSVSYYDNYDFISKNSVPATIQYIDQPSGFGSRYKESANGLLTGRITAKLGASGVDGYLYAAFYYDNKGRVIQSQSTNHLNGLEQEYVAYNLVGDPVKRQHKHSKGTGSQEELYTYEYDYAGRLIKTTHKLNNNGVVVLSENTYDKVGRLEFNKKYGNTSLSNSLTSTYTYNVRSWPKSITIGTLFAQTLYYNDSYGSSTAQYNGNISAMSWQASGDDLRGYAFSYDHLSRLTNANYLVNGSANSNYKTSYSYDKQGNLKKLLRYGKTSATAYGIMDNLTYSYSGNQLHNVSDTGTDPLYAGAFNFIDGNKTSTQEYQYYKNGNLKLDYNKKIALIQYNNLNLPDALQFTNGHRTDYLYSADGEKLKVVHKTAIANVVVAMGNLKELATNEVSRTDWTDYCGNMVYENDNLSKILTGEGYITLNGTTPIYHYYLKDHQGNNRVVTYWNGSKWVIEQVNHYYPFGGLFAEGTTTSNQPYKYKGKELDRMYGLDWYDYEARMYDSALGRFMVMDPSAEKYYSISPYAYCNDNPIRYIDPTGLKFTEAAWKQVNRLINDINKRQVSNANDIANKQIQIDEGGLSDKKVARLQRQIDKLKGNNTELKEVSEELTILAASSQMYDIRSDNSMNVEEAIPGMGEYRSSAAFNFTNGNFEITLGDSSLGMLAHELKHAYQFETGAFSSSNYSNGSPFYDKSDELEAYSRGSLFGAPRVRSLPPLYDNLQNGPIDATNHPNIMYLLGNPDVLQKIVNKSGTKMAFRIKGVTYRTSK